MARVAYLLETPRLVVGEFICAPDDDAWSMTNRIGDSPHVVFPLVPVRITQIDKGSVLATPNHTIFYDAGQLYDRQLCSDHGDHCIFVSVEPETLARTLHTSPFHLARVFRSETGFTVAGYRRALRLRAALEQLPTRAKELTALALDLGFSSHSHFSDAFRRGFGLTPSSLM